MGFVKDFGATALISHIMAHPQENHIDKHTQACLTKFFATKFLFNVQLAKRSKENIAGQFCLHFCTFKLTTDIQT